MFIVELFTIMKNTVTITFPYIHRSQNFCKSYSDNYELHQEIKAKFFLHNACSYLTEYTLLRSAPFDMDGSDSRYGRIR